MSFYDISYNLYLPAQNGTFLSVCRSLKKEVSMKIEHPEKSPWDSGFSIFRRRIDEQLQLGGMDSSFVDDDMLLPYYRAGESEIYVLGALGCPVGI